ncbi:MAG TPA: hypothetical protein VJ123_03925 [Anaerolineales bacterium]|nr:hypothetical protein [Anaerolineales bacterium]
MADRAPWEYRVETLGSIWRGSRPQDLEGILNQAAGEGWELSEIAAHGNRLWVVLRREAERRSRDRSASWPQ